MRVILAACAALCLAAPAHAAVFTFSYHIPGYNPDVFIDAAGTLTTTDAPGVDGSFLIIGITGTRTSYEFGDAIVSAITGLTPPGSNYNGDDKLFSMAPFLSESGLTFALADSPGDDFQGNANVYYYNGGYYEPIEGFSAGTFSLNAVTSVPEPASLALFAGAGIIVLGARRRH